MGNDDNISQKVKSENRYNANTSKKMNQNLNMTSNDNIRNYNQTEAGKNISIEGKSNIVDEDIKNMQLQSHDFIKAEDELKDALPSDDNYGIQKTKQTMSPRSKKSGMVNAPKSIDLSQKSKVNSNSQVRFVDTHIREDNNNDS